MSNLELLAEPDLPPRPDDWPENVNIEDDWTVLRDARTGTVILFNEDHGRQIPTNDKMMIDALLARGAKLAVRPSGDSEYIYVVERSASSDDVAQHGRVVLELGLAAERGRRKRLRAALQAGLATGTRVQGILLRREYLPGIEMSQMDLDGADLSGSWMPGANLHLATLRGARMAGINLTDAYLDAIDARGATLEGAVCAGASLRSANLEDAVLRNADLRGAELINANLARADLGGANLTGANLSGTNFAHANLDGAELGDAELDSETTTIVQRH